MSYQQQDPLQNTRARNYDDAFPPMGRTPSSARGDLVPLKPARGTAPPPEFKLGFATLIQNARVEQGNTTKLSRGLFHSGAKMVEGRLGLGPPVHMTG